MNKEFISPVRKIKMNYLSPTGIFQSLKNGGSSVAFESMLERNMFVTLEFDKSVKSYVEQPIKIVLQLKSRKTTYHPDCLISYINGAIRLIEVKYTSELESKKDYFEEKFEATKKYAVENGMEFGVFTEQDILKEALANMLFIYKWAFHEIQDEVKSTIKSIILQNNPITINQLMALISENKKEQLKMMPSIWKMILTNELDIEDDLSDLTMNTNLRLGSNG